MRAGKERMGRPPPLPLTQPGVRHGLRGLLALWLVCGAGAALCLRPTPCPTARRRAPHTLQLHAERGLAVVLTGFEQFNTALYTKVEASVRDELDVRFFTDRDIGHDELDHALRDADVFFGSLLFDYDEVAWLTPRVERVKTRFIFESALELMSLTRVGSFTMADGGSGPPAPVKALLSKFGSSKEEDRVAGYLKFLKLGPGLLRFVPGEKAADLRLWLEVYAYWNQGGATNVENMLRLLGRRLGLSATQVMETRSALGRSAGSTHRHTGALSELPPPMETPAIGLVHPKAPGKYFESLSEYLHWYGSESSGVPRSLRVTSAPNVGVLLYRKHVVSRLKYIDELIMSLEKNGLRPLPIFINGVEAHTVVRDCFTSKSREAKQTVARDAGTGLAALGRVRVDAVVNTIGFPLVGGPAGSMAAGRRTDIAASILAELDVPYCVAAPLLLQSEKDWKRNGVMGLQQVVLYALPELDGAIETLVLGGLDGDDVILDHERLDKLASRLHGWLRLRSKPPCHRRVAVILYGFPPNVGATGTAALLDVPSSLEALLVRLKEEGYDLGVNDVKELSGQALVSALAVINTEAALAGGAEKLPRVLEAALTGTKGSNEEEPGFDHRHKGLGNAQVIAQAVDAATLRRWLGPELSTKMEKQWGQLDFYRGLATQSDGKMVCAGLRLGNVFLGVQPMLGIEGDPMRLSFERDLTPHPQYAAFYKWLMEEHGGIDSVTDAEIDGGAACNVHEKKWDRTATWKDALPQGGVGIGIDALVHFGMHGTVEWLPGSPLGGTAHSWPDALLGSAPNLYVYAANNPSEAILAKRRGYATLISHLVPPYGRAGLYGEVAKLRELVSEYRSEPQSRSALRSSIADTITSSGFAADVPPPPEVILWGALPDDEKTSLVLGELGEKTTPSIDGERVEALAALLREDQSKLSSWNSAFDMYMLRVEAHLLELQERLFSQGLHVLGRPPDEDLAFSYLNAYFEDQWPPSAPQQIAQSPKVPEELQHSNKAASQAGKADKIEPIRSEGEHLVKAIDEDEQRQDTQPRTWPPQLVTILEGSADSMSKAAGLQQILRVVSAMPRGASVADASAALIESDPHAFSWTSRIAADALAADAEAATMDALSGEVLSTAAAASNAHPEIAPMRSWIPGTAMLKYLTKKREELLQFFTTQISRASRAISKRSCIECANVSMAAGAKHAKNLRAIGGTTIKAYDETPMMETLEGRAHRLLCVDDDPISLHGGSSGLQALAPQFLEAVEIRQKLWRTSDEIDSLMHALDGGYVRPGVGGDLLRDGAGVLPTGRNIHALDPYRVPSTTASLRGAAAARQVLLAQRDTAGGVWPETIAVALWGLNEIKTRGEAVAVVLEIVGATVVHEATGRVGRYELLPLDQLYPPGRPRIDVLASLSAIFRDSFSNVVDLLDDLFERAANADEPPALNYIRKHAMELEAEGEERPASRLFSNPPGDYGSLVNELVGSGDWETTADLGATWASRNGVSYGRHKEKQGVAREAVLEKLLGTTERIVQMVDSVEYGLTDIQEYYANTGALKASAESARQRRKLAEGVEEEHASEALSNLHVGVSVVEAFTRSTPVSRDLETCLRMEYRSKLLNPVWAEAMASQGSGGAYEISQRFTAMVGWGATARFADEWAFQGAFERYVADEDMRRRLAKSNPEAIRNVARRLLEAYGRGMWTSASEEQLDTLKDMYADAEDVVELGVRAVTNEDMGGK